MKHWKIFALVVVVLLGGFWLLRSLAQPVPGQAVEDMGREHVSPEQSAKITFNSNPPTSGPHLPTWVKAGIYDQPQIEGELIHSLEHGYIIISYNCNVHPTSFRLNSLVSLVSAHEEGEEVTSSGKIAPAPEASGSATNPSETCKTLVSQLGKLAQSKRLWKLILVPRPELDTTIALTAWDYLDKFDTFDTKRTGRFIDYHRDQGPEKTME